MNRIENYWNILNKNTEWVRFSDTKAVFILTIYSVLITIIYSNAHDVLESLKSSMSLLGVSALAGIFSLISIFFLFKCIFPRTENKNPNSVIFFGHVIKYKSVDEYFNESYGIVGDEKQMCEKLVEQIHSVSTIASVKYKNVKWAITFFILSLLILLSGIIIYLIKCLLI